MELNNVSAASAAHAADPVLWALPQVLACVACGRATWWRYVRDGKAPGPVVRLGPRFTRWAAADVKAWATNPAAWIAERAQTEAAEVV